MTNKYLQYDKYYVTGTYNTRSKLSAWHWQLFYKANEQIEVEHHLSRCTGPTGRDQRQKCHENNVKYCL